MAQAGRVNSLVDLTQLLLVDDMYAYLPVQTRRLWVYKVRALSSGHRLSAGYAYCPVVRPALAAKAVLYRSL